MTIDSTSVSSLISGLLLIVSTNSMAYVNHVSDAPISTDRLVEFYETTEVADDIWNNLTNNFVDQYESGQYAQAAHCDAVLRLAP